MRRQLFRVKPVAVGRCVASPAGASQLAALRLMSTILMCAKPSTPTMPFRSMMVGLAGVAANQVRFYTSSAAGPATQGLAEIAVPNAPDSVAVPGQSTRTAIVTAFDAAARTVQMELRFKRETVSHTVQLPTEDADLPVSFETLEAFFAPTARVPVLGRVVKDRTSNELTTVVSKLFVPIDACKHVELVIVETRAATSHRGMAVYAVEKDAPADGGARTVYMAPVETALKNEVETPESQLQPGVTITGRALTPSKETKRKMCDLSMWSIADPAPSVDVTPEMIAAVEAVRPAPREPRADSPAGSESPRSYPAQLLVIEKAQPGLERQRFARFHGDLVVIRDCTLAAGTYVRATLEQVSGSARPHRRAGNRKPAAPGPNNTIAWTASGVEEVAEPARARGTVVALRKNSARVVLDDTDGEPKTVGVVFSGVRTRDTRVPDVGLSREDLRDKIKVGARVEGIVLAPTRGPELRSVTLLDAATNTTEHPAVAALLANPENTATGDWRVAVVSESRNSGASLLRFAAPPHDAPEHSAALFPDNVDRSPRIGDVVEVLLKAPSASAVAADAEAAASLKPRHQHVAAMLPGHPTATESGLRGTVAGSAQMGKLKLLKIELSDGRIAFMPLNPKQEGMATASASSMCDISVIADFGPDKALIVTGAKRGICRGVAARVNNATEKVAYMRLHPTAEQTAESGIMPGQTAYALGPSVQECRTGAWVSVTVDTTAPGSCDYAARHARAMDAPADAPEENAAPIRRASSSASPSSKKRASSPHPDRRRASSAREGEATFASRTSASAPAADGSLPGGYLPVEFGLSGTVVTDKVLGSYAVRPDGFDEPIAVDTAHASAATLDLVRPGARLSFDMAVHPERPDCVALNVRR